MSKGPGPTSSRLILSAKVVFSPNLNPAVSVHLVRAVYGAGSSLHQHFLPGRGPLVGILEPNK